MHDGIMFTSELNICASTAMLMIIIVLGFVDEGFLDVPEVTTELEIIFPEDVALNIRKRKIGPISSFS